MGRDVYKRQDYRLSDKALAYLMNDYDQQIIPIVEVSITSMLYFIPVPIVVFHNFDAVYIPVS